MAGMHDVMNAMKRLIETILGSISGLRCTQPDLMLFLHVGQVWLYWMKMGYTAHYLVTTRIVISDPFEWQNAKPIFSCPSRVTSLRLHLVKYWCFNQLHFCECKVVKEGKRSGCALTNQGRAKLPDLKSVSSQRELRDQTEHFFFDDQNWECSVTPADQQSCINWTAKRPELLSASPGQYIQLKLDNSSIV